MKIEKFKVNKKEIEMERQNPFVLVELNGNGCGLDNCKCSPPNFISVSDGKNGFEVILTDEEAKELRETGMLDVENVGGDRK